MSDEQKLLSESEEKDIILNDLKTEWPIEKDVSFNEFNIQEKLQNHAFILMKYQNQYDNEKFKLDKILELKEKLVGDRYHYYRFNYDESLQKAEIEKYYLPKDEKILKINRLIRLQEVRVNFFLICVKILDKMGWNMKNFLESHKLF